MLSIIQLLFLSVFVALSMALPTEDRTKSIRHINARDINITISGPGYSGPGFSGPGRRAEDGAELLDKRKDGTVCLAPNGPRANYDDCNNVCTTLLHDASQSVFLMPYYQLNLGYGNCRFWAENTSPCNPVSFVYGTVVAVCQAMMGCVLDTGKDGYHVGDSIAMNFGLMNPLAVQPQVTQIACQDGPP